MPMDPVSPPGDYFDDILKDIDPEVLMQLGIMPEKQKMLEGQMSQANALRNAPMPEMRHAGRAVVAAHPLEFIGRGVERLVGEHQASGLQDKMNALTDQKLKSRLAFIQALRSPSTPAGGGSAAPGEGFGFDMGSAMPQQGMGEFAEGEGPEMGMDDMGGDEDPVLHARLKRLMAGRR